jgi:hypothetical protein
VVGGPVEEALHAVQLVRVVEGPVVDVGVIRSAGGHALRLLGESRGELVVDPRPGQHTGRRGAVLAGVEVARAGDPLCGCSDVGVVEDDDRSLAAEL